MSNKQHAQATLIQIFIVLVRMTCQLLSVGCDLNQSLHPLFDDNSWLPFSWATGCSLQSALTCFWEDVTGDMWFFCQCVSPEEVVCFPACAWGLDLSLWRLSFQFAEGKLIWLLKTDIPNFNCITNSWELSKTIAKPVELAICCWTSWWHPLD